MDRAQRLQDDSLAKVSRATSPSGGTHDTNAVNGDTDHSKSRTRPRTYPYFTTLPYEVEDEARRQKDLSEILKHLYIAVQSCDFTPGAVHWTRELRSWMSLKFDPTKEQRIKLVNLYYELALAPGIDPSVSERFASMFMLLTKRKHYLRPQRDLTLDWRPLFREIKIFVIPAESGLIQTTNAKRNIKTLVKMSSFAQLYFDPEDIPAMLDEILPHFTMSFTEGAFVVTALLNLLLPTAPPPPNREDLLPQQHLPTFFHLWSLLNRSKTVDIAFLDLFSRMARDTLPSPDVPFSQYGIFTQEQTTLIFTAILRLLEIPVGQSTSPYSALVDLSAGMAVLIDRDSRKHPVSHHIARWIVMSLSPQALDAEGSIFTLLTNLMDSIETFFHPSNAGAWTKTLSQLVFYLADFFVMRWNREHNGELDVPEDRRLTPELRRRFVLCLRDVIFMGIYSKSSTAMSYSLSTLSALANLEPELILPGALKRIYPSMQGLVEVHRTVSSLRSLHALSRVMIRSKGYRCHITALLGLALPGIDANDLDKTLYTLTFFSNVCYNIPFVDLSQGREDVQGNMIAMQWITGEMEKLDAEQEAAGGAPLELNYHQLDDREEEMVLASSTAGFSEFVSSFLGRVFTLLENLPDASRIRSGSPEENIVNTLPATFLPLLSSLSPELFDQALNKIVDFVATHVIHQSRDAMAFICNCLCKVNPEKALAKLVPVLTSAIRVEIDENGAGSTRNAASDVLPRDRALVWNVSMLSMCVVHVGSAVLNHKKELFDIAIYMQTHCKGMPTVHISNYIHHLLLNLTGTYTVDCDLYEPERIKDGITGKLWGFAEPAKSLKPKWHVPSEAEIDFAVELFRAQAETAMSKLNGLLDGTSSIKRDGSGKEWSDEVSRNLVLFRLLLAGVSILFDAKGVNEGLTMTANGIDADTSMSMANGHAPEATSEADAYLDGTDETSIKPSFQYPTGFNLTPADENYKVIHRIRKEIGETLHKAHVFLSGESEDDVSSFAPLYTAYRTWFVDVGIERSAHVLDRITRLLQADEQPYKVSGKRKDYPRAILVRRANVYHTQRLRHNAAPRPRSTLDEQLLLDLVKSSSSIYTEVRRNAQAAGEAALKVVFGARLFVIPPLLETFKKSVADNDFPRIKGALFALLFGSLSKTVGRHWKYAPDIIRTFIEASSADKPSIQKLCSGGLYQVMDYGRPVDRTAIVEQGPVEAIAPSEDVADKIEKKKKFIISKRTNIERKKSELAEELIQQARASHWKKAQRISTLVMSLGMRFDHIASDDMIELIAHGTIDQHPNLRGLYSQGMIAVFTMTDVRAVCDHSYLNYIRGIQEFPAKVKVTTESFDKTQTAEYLNNFAQPDADVYIDHDYPGWLVWCKEMPGYKSNISQDIVYDDLEWSKRKVIGKILDRNWFKTFFKYLKQEPRDSNADKFRMPSAMLLTYAFELIIRDGLAVATFEDIKEETLAVYGNGSDKHQHRATAEILAGLITAVMDTSMERRSKVWDFAFPIVQRVFADGLTPENSAYWTTFLHMILQSRDPRRAWPLVDWLANFRLDMQSNAAFKESSKIHLLHQVVMDAGWHFQLDKPLTKDFLAHIDHPYKGVREAMAQTLATITRTRYHESYPDVASLVRDQKQAGSIGKQPYIPTDEFDAAIRDAFDRIEKWRHERTPGQQTPSAYTSGSKTVLLWLEAMLTSYECTQLLQYFPDVFMEQFLHMMDVKEDPELQSLAYHVFRHLPNIPHRIGQDEKLIGSLIRIGQTSKSWHQRLRVMINIQIIFFRRLFLLSNESKQKLFDCVAGMLEDPQHEVRAGAATTLSGMIRCSPFAFQQAMVTKLGDRFKKMLADNPLPKKPKGRQATALASVRSSGTATPTPEHQRLIITRHAAVLGLGALIQAFPYASPPPQWMCGLLSTLSNRAASDPGMVGSAVKNIISDFKKTRQDTWHIDVKVSHPQFTSYPTRESLCTDILTTGIHARRHRGSVGRALEELFCLSSRLLLVRLQC
jgi:proteasome activator subunit 4